MRKSITNVIFVSAMIMSPEMAISETSGITPIVEAEAFASVPTYTGDDMEFRIDGPLFKFCLWSPMAQAARLKIYNDGVGGKPIHIYEMEPDASSGVWRMSTSTPLMDKFYTFQIKYNGEWLDETPGVWAKALGVNGKRAAIIDMATTNPRGWLEDRGPEVKSFTDVVLYEMHHRDFSMAEASGMENKGKFLALTEHGTTTPGGQPTGIDHLRDLGVTHVHILPSYDYFTVDEEHPEIPQYNWGYDPLNYNVPEGSYSSNAADPKARIREFKQMVQALHRAGIKLVLDVVYNHTMDIDNSNFQRTVPGYFFRQRQDGSWGDASGCGNETASERAVMRKYMIESVKFGIAGAIAHPQIDMKQVNYSKQAWAKQPHQMISYVSCHDDMCLTDRLRASVPGLAEATVRSATEKAGKGEADLIRLDLLAQTAVFTSQGIPFMQAGEEMLRDKKGVHNSYKSPDSINAIDWSRKDTHPEVFDYYRRLIRLRNEHPAFRLNDADLVRRHLSFLEAPSNVVAFRLADHAGGDTWQDIIVVLNAKDVEVSVSIPEGHYEKVAHDGRIDLNGLGGISGSSVTVAPRSATILYR